MPKMSPPPASIKDQIVTNAHGGRQSHIEERIDLIPWPALSRVARTLAEGNQKYGPRNYLCIEARDHLNHALRHLFLALTDDASEDHG